MCISDIKGAWGPEHRIRVSSIQTHSESEREKVAAVHTNASSRVRTTQRLSTPSHHRHGNSVAATSGEEEGDAWPQAQAQGGQDRGPLGFENEEGPAATATAQRRREVHSVEVSRPRPLRLARQPQPRLAFPLLPVQCSTQF